MDENQWPARRQANLGIRYGLLGGLFSVLFMVVLGFAFRDRNLGDVLSWLIGWIIIFLAARQAAMKARASQEISVDSAQNIRAASIGTAIVAVVVVWAYVFGRDILTDEASYFTVISCVRIPIDTAMALGIGVGVAKTAEKNWDFDRDPF